MIACTRLDYIDGLRAVAIGVVVAFHAHLSGFPNGYLGVDIFFVISGFLITGQIFGQVASGSLSLADFYARRIVRLGPPLLIVVVATLIAACILPLLPGDMRQIALSTMPTAAMVANWYFWINADYFAPEAQRQPLLHLWSLGVEEQYYLVVPAAVLGLAVLARRNRGDLNLFGLAGTALVLVCALVAAAAFARSKPEADFFVTPLRAWEFAIGGAAILLLRRGLVLRQVPAHAGMTAGLLAIAAAVTIEATGPERRLLLQVLAAAGAGTVVLCGMFARGSAACRFLGLKPMVGLGIISYSLYLWHWPVLAFVRLTQLDDTSVLQNVLAAIVVPMLLAILTYWAVERPLRAWRQSALPTARLRTIAQGAGASVLVATFGIAVVLWSVHLNSTEPFRAFAEIASPFRDVCRPGARDAASRGCRMGTDTDPRVLVVGDSHALAIAEALRITAGEKRLSAMLEWDGGCPPLLGSTIFVGETPWTACMRTNEAVMRWLGGPELRSVTGVVLVGAWHIHFGHVAASATDRIGKLSDAMTHTVGELRALGLRVLVVGPVPSAPYRVPECIFLARSEAELRRCRFTTDEVALAQHGMIEALRSAAARFDNTRFLDLRQAFCDTAFCWPGRDGIIYYNDTNHLTKAGARVVHDHYRAEFAWVFSGEFRSRPLASGAK